MKIRIQGNSVRYRLSKSEVAALEKDGYLEETTSFGPSRLVYAVQKSVDNDLTARYGDNRITLFVPSGWLNGWTADDRIGFEGTVSLDGNNSLYLLIEKDFKCLDNASEDQSNNYENPNKTC